MPRTSSISSPTLPVPGADYQPAEVLMINTPEQLKIISDPLRMQILECVSLEALSVKQIAARLSQPATKLYYHVSALEEGGFMVVVDTRIKSGILEKYYRIAAQNIQVKRGLLRQSGAADDALQSMLTAVFDATVADLQQSAAVGMLDLNEENEGNSHRLILARDSFHLRSEDVPRFVAKIHDLLKEMSAAEDKTDPVSYGCTIAFYPRAEPRNRKNSPKSSVS
jgi:DNA-binding transcriptional ArsR family regulator